MNTIDKEVEIQMPLIIFEEVKRDIATEMYTIRASKSYKPTHEANASFDKCNI